MLIQILKTNKTGLRLNMLEFKQFLMENEENREKKTTKEEKYKGDFHGKLLQSVHGTMFSCSRKEFASKKISLRISSKFPFL
jgi:hypothetical protein